LTVLQPRIPGKMPPEKRGQQENVDREGATTKMAVSWDL